LKRIIFLLCLGCGLALSGRTPVADNNPAGLEFVFITGGTFDMGDIFNRGDADSRPVHRVTVSDFYLGKTEVTVAQFRVFCKATRRRMPLAPEWGFQEDHPVVNVNWTLAQAFCDWAGGRLPTEAEWEYAARNRGDSLRFDWGNGAPFGPAGGNVADESLRVVKPRTLIFEGYTDGWRFTSPVASFDPNPLGLADMTGNVWEWCADWHGPFAPEPAVDPKGPACGTHRVLRGGSWMNDPASCGTTNRFRNRPKNFYECYGFRVAR